MISEYAFKSLVGSSMLSQSMYTSRKQAGIAVVCGIVNHPSTSGLLLVAPLEDHGWSTLVRLLWLLVIKSDSN